ncbi:DUF3604 domain-containing protein [Alphaproteobacteria bacterium]|nr:DUF3604 domain-containing protein [Alphaproteobacteria bacterium]
MPYNDYRQDLMGEARLTPSGQFEIDTYQSFKLIYTAGKFGIDDQGGLRIGFRGHFDGSAIQFSDPAAPGYTTVEASNGAVLEVSWEARRNIRPWNKSLYIRCLRFLREGDQIVINFGDQSKGSPGWLLQTFCESAFTFQITVDPFATQDFIALPSAANPTISMVPGDPVNWKAVLPTLRRPGEGFRLSIKGDDRWGNPSNRLTGKIKLKTNLPVTGLNETVDLKKGDFGVVIEGLSVESPGVLHLTVLDENDQLIATANPLVIRAADAAHFWSDMHAQSGETIGVGTAREYFDFARNKAFLDIAGHQGNDFQITDAFWQHLNELTAEYNEDNRFMTLPGYEWSGNTGLGGDHNVWFRTEGRPIYRSSRALISDRTYPENDVLSTPDLIEKLQSEDAIVVAHVGGRYADIKYAHDAKLEPSVEVHSSWGTFEWILRDAFESGYRVGIVGSSDGHKGRPGAEYPGDSQFGSYGGLTCHLLPQLDRDTFFDAFRNRRHYATTGARIYMDVTASLGERTLQIGDIVSTDLDHLDLAFDIIGTAPIERVDIFNGLDLVRTIRPWHDQASLSRLRVTCAGQHYRGRGRLVKWDVSANLTGGKIDRIDAVNFWNPNRQPKQISATEAVWKTVTTGGASSVDFWLDDAALASQINVQTNFESVSASVADIDENGITIDCGGMDIRLHIERLPGILESFSLAGEQSFALVAGTEQRLYVRVTQEDGHQAWSSPIYVAKA